MRRHKWVDDPNRRGWQYCERDGCKMASVIQSRCGWRYYLNDHPSRGGGWVKRAGECKGKDKGNE